jgi:hypothetical protein
MASIVAQRTPAAVPRSFASALGRTYAAMLVVAAPLLALLLTPGLMRSRVAWFEGSSWLGIIGFEVLSLLTVLGSVAVSAAVAGAAAQWRPRTAWASSRDLRRRRPGRWWRLLGEAFGWFLASQLVGGYLAWLVPYIWRDSTGGWVLDYPNYAMQAIGMYLVICFAAAWFGTRIRHDVLATTTSQTEDPA